jgi:hypothetical protein
MLVNERTLHPSALPSQPKLAREIARYYFMGIGAALAAVTDTNKPFSAHLILARSKRSSRLMLAERINKPISTRDKPTPTVAEFDGSNAVDSLKDGFGLDGRNPPRMDGSLTLIKEIGEIGGLGGSGLIVTGSRSATEISGLDASFPFSLRARFCNIGD